MNLDLVYTNATVVTATNSSVKTIKNCTIGLKKGKIAYIGKEKRFKAKKIIDLQGKLVTPGLIEVHTHLIFAGDRSKDFEMKQKGMSYEQIARNGGGIYSTVSATRKATAAELFNLAKSRVDTFIHEGVTSLEIKSGYGLDFDNELKMLEVAKKLKEYFPIAVQSTYLAHVIPEKYKKNPNEFINLLCNKFLPLLKKRNLADVIDVFCEKIAFNRHQTEKIFIAAKKLGFPIKIHAEQLSRIGGSSLAAKYKALSADHLDFANKTDLILLKKSGVIAVLMPGAFYFLNEKMPPVDLIKKYKVPFAISTDYNPGSSPINSLLTTANFAINLFGLTPAEVFRGVTINAARALGMEKEVGSIEVGKQADLVIWEANSINSIFYTITAGIGKTVVKNGKVVYDTHDQE